MNRITRHSARNRPPLRGRTATHPLWQQKLGSLKSAARPVVRPSPPRGRGLGAVTIPTAVMEPEQYPSDHAVQPTQHRSRRPASQRPPVRGRLATHPLFGDKTQHSRDLVYPSPSRGSVHPSLSRVNVGSDKAAPPQMVKPTHPPDHSFLERSQKTLKKWLGERLGWLSNSDKP